MAASEGMRQVTKRASASCPGGQLEPSQPHRPPIDRLRVVQPVHDGFRVVDQSVRRIEVME